MESSKIQSQFQKKKRDIKNVFTLCEITKIIMLPINSIGKNLHITIESTISKMIGGKCIVEGYVKPNSVKVVTHSSGTIKGQNVIFDVVFLCEVCYPVAGMLLNCTAKNITKAGIRAESSDESPSPFVLFIARDHYYSNDYFNSLQENEKFVSRVIAQRFELNDKYVSVIGEIVPPQKDERNELKPRLTII
uniref:S1 motif domain-containing protein n=1 Tax=viral metagenome TaxID=1070528 RepID=A0A6C0IU59_9ZZZZ